ncbi:MAG: MgtC/SapB family protein [Clostridia bacterium]|nr:MgtC/SapB family protein [Clostridia bacterium]
MPEEILELLQGINPFSVVLRTLLSLLLGGCIGLERGYHGRAAGLRTHILVCLGACMAAMIGVFAVWELGFSSDPLRVGAQVVSGIGFLGVGTIIVQNHSQVTGLTTAAALWATACVGLAIGIGFYSAALVAFLAIFITTTLLIRLEKHSKVTDTNVCYVEFSNSENAKQFCKEMMPYAAKVDVVPAKSGIADHIGLVFKSKTKQDYSYIIARSEESRDVVISVPVRY